MKRKEMKERKIYFIHKKFSKKGQALTELAIFGSILLFCVAMLTQYGLDANYQQQIQMEAFRKAQKIAFYRSGPNAATSLALVKDKPFPDPRDQFGFAERNTVVASGSVVWDTNLSSQYIKDFDGSALETDLPAVYFEIEGVDGKTVVNKATQDKIEDIAHATVPLEAGENNAFGFYTARFDKAPCPDVITVPDETTVVIAGKKQTVYTTKQIKKSDIWVGRIEGAIGSEIKTKTGSVSLMYPYYRDDDDADYPLLKRRIADADVDGDGELEYIIGADKDKNLFYVDSHDPKQSSSGTIAGAIQIDTRYTQIEAGDRIWDEKTMKWIELTPEHRQGMIQDFEKTLKHAGSQIVKTENAGAIISKTKLDAEQVITHKIRMNGGQVLDIPVKFPTDPNKVLYKWNKE
ncbi:MAG: hypothetical protein Q8R31_05535 [Candidatus Omnitrophota bacterium]|nr:hypothetical protein [Candidatus Omnitrophota bacterium]